MIDVIIYVFGGKAGGIGSISVISNETGEVFSINKEEYLNNIAKYTSLMKVIHEKYRPQLGSKNSNFRKEVDI